MGTKRALKFSPDPRIPDGSFCWLIQLVLFFYHSWAYFVGFSSSIEKKNVCFLSWVKAIRKQTKHGPLLPFREGVSGPWRGLTRRPRPCLPAESPIIMCCMNSGPVYPSTPHRPCLFSPRYSILKFFFYAWCTK